MAKKKLLFQVLTICAILIVAGCSKKKTKVEVTPEPEPPQEVVAPQEDPDEVVYEPVDMDAKMRELLVPVYFDYDKWDLRPEAIEILERIASFLNEHTTVRLLLEGHADERGTNEYNIGLGENRAKAVRKYLTGYGIDSSRLDFTSYGREQPAIPNCPDEPCHAKNRRVEWKVLQK